MFTSISALILATKLIDKKMEFIQQRLDNKQDVEGEYLTYLLSNTQMSNEDVYGSISELLLAGVDTVNVILFQFPQKKNIWFSRIKPGFMQKSAKKKKKKKQVVMAQVTVVHTVKSLSWVWVLHVTLSLSISHVTCKAV